MKLDEVRQELIPARETPREVEGEWLGPRVNKTLESVTATLADQIVDDWWRASQKAWAAGEKDNPEYERIGDFLSANFGDVEKRVSEALRQLERRLSEKTYDMSADRARRWSRGGAAELG